jgi:hypothetical protein
VWHAVVQWLAPPGTRWQDALIQTTAPHDQFVSSPFSEAVDARAWCLRMIGEQASKTSDGQKDITQTWRLVAPRAAPVRGGKRSSITYDGVVRSAVEP